MESPRDRKYFARKKVCRFCTESLEMNYKNIDTLSRYITDRKKIVPKRNSGLCARCQRQLATEIKRARFMALLPYTVLH
ncbi:MAG: 30S ribosomal protein S18 [Candidatus Dadabacteria bacterium]|nr:30S ribosomal protein S18 [Candidatus Dadabacteria bacterium]HML94968.1 30S ribosomal protein S18 [Thermodesulfobacteriota bacterium]